MPAQEQLEGTVEKVLFESAQSGFIVFALSAESGKSVTVTGTLSSIYPGEIIQVTGSWINHPKFGKQFHAEQCQKQMPVTVVGIQKYLASGLIKGIGPAYAKKIVDRFGQQALDIIDQEPHRLKEVPGLGSKRMECIMAAWHDQREVSRIMAFLQERGTSPLLATKIYKKYGQEAIGLLTENPYRLTQDIWGVGFKLADTIAQHMGFVQNSVKRIKAGICYVLTLISQQGHLYAELSSLKSQVGDLLALGHDGVNNIKIALHELYEVQKIKLITCQNGHYVALAHCYFSEKRLAQKIESLQKHESSIKFDAQRLFAQIRISDSTGTHLNEQQEEAIISSFEHKVAVITGGPGTGKTTLIKKLLAILDDRKISYKLAAPTGRAAKRMTESTGKYAATLHRLLEFDPISMAFKYNEQNALAADFFIIDEASMIDVFLAHSLFKAVPLQAHVVLIGDIDQLPSVGPGYVLCDLIKSNKVACVRLQHIFRQAQNSLITLNAHKVNKGEFPSLKKSTGIKKDFLFIHESAPEKLEYHFKKIINMVRTEYGYQTDHMMTLVPMNRGTAGTFHLNAVLQQLLNPQQTSHVTVHGVKYFIGDRVMQIRNNYDKRVFNGDIGFIEHIDKEMQELTVTFGGIQVRYGFEEINELVLAYAISIHKSQGSEYDVVVIPIFMQHYIMLARNLIYTAITRAKKLCIFVGQVKALAMAVKNDKTVYRKTFLSEFLTSDLQSR